MLFEDAAALWRQQYAQGRVDTTIWAADERLRWYILPTLGGRDTEELTQEELQTMADALADGTAQGSHRGLAKITVRKTMTQVRCILEAAHLRTNPAEGLSYRGMMRRAQPIVVSSPEDVQRLIAAAKPAWMGDLILLAYHTGMRRGEMFGLKWEDVDLRLRQLSVVRSIACHAFGERLEHRTKTETSCRTILLDAATVEMLARRKGKAKPGSVWVLEGRGGCALSPWYSMRYMAQTCDRAGLKRRTLHSLRHSHVTLLLSKGVYVKVVQERVGHARAETTLNVYAHALGSMQEDAVKVLDGI